MTVDKTINFTERSAAPDTPATGDWRLYFKSGGLYIVDDAGAETLLGAAGGGGANTALSNLAAVAINTSLVSDTDNTDDLGSTSIYWRNAYLNTAYMSEQAAPATPAAGKVVIYPKADGLMYSKDDAGTETLMSSGAGGGGAPTDATYIVQTANAGLSAEQALSSLSTGLAVVTTGTGVISTVAAPTGAVVGTTDTQTLTNKTYDADGTGNVITNIGSSEVKPELIAGLTADATPDGAADYVMTYDNSATLLKKVLLNNLPTGGGGASYAIIRDEKATTTAGGGSTATTWNARNLNTELYDPDSIVAIASNQFTPIAGDYIMIATAPARAVNTHRIRLYNVTGAASVEEGINTSSNAADVTASLATLTCAFTANGTDAYRIDHYTAATKATDGLGNSVSDGSAEVYLQIELIKVG